MSSEHLSVSVLFSLKTERTPKPSGVTTNEWYKAAQFGES